MGNDGGSIPTRRELAKTAKQAPTTTEAKATLLESQTHHWQNCPLSHRPLVVPIVSDCAGLLYNKDAVLEFLLPGNESEASRIEMEAFLNGRVKSLKDIVEVKFQVETDVVTKLEKKVCPITKKELGPATKAVYLVPCGHAFSDLSIKEVRSDICMSCNEPYLQDNAITILPVLPEDVSRLKERIQLLKGQGLAHSLKRASKEKKRRDKQIANEAAASEIIRSENSSKKRALEQDVVPDLKELLAVELHPNNGTSTSSGGIKNAATASLTAKVMLEQEELNKRRKLGLNSNLKSLFSNKDSVVPGSRSGDFMTRG